MPDGTQMTSRGLAKYRRRCTRWMKNRSICSVASKSAITPSLSGRIASDVVRRTADHPLGLGADGEDLAGLGVHRDDGGLVEHHAAAADVDQGVGRAEVHRHVAADDAACHRGASSLRAPVTDAGRGDRGLPVGDDCSTDLRTAERPSAAARSG